MNIIYNSFTEEIDIKSSQFTESNSLFFCKNPILVSCRESVIENRRSFYGRFYIGPLDIGQGMTLANALRRVLLSELQGLAITCVEIEGISHEYSVIPGVRESVLDILLNLKQIVLKSKITLKRPQIAYLYCKGPGVLRAADIFLPSFIQCVDPEQYITTLSHNGILKIKLIIRQGKNYLVNKPTHSNSDLVSNKIMQKKNYNLPEKTRYEISDKINKRTKLNSNKIFLTDRQTSKFLKKSKITSLELVKTLLKNRKLNRKKNSLVFLSEDLKKLESLRSIRRIFENSKTKSWFISFLKKQLIFIFLKNSNSKIENLNSEFYKPNFMKISSITKPLFIDAVFMPVTRVNYILEESQQKLFDEFLNNELFQNRTDFNELNKLENKLKPISSDSEKLNFERNKEITEDTHFVYSKLKQNEFSNYWSFFHEQSNSSLPTFSPILKSAYFFKHFNTFPKEVIILEIWTNGSILPRTALSKATKKLLCLFLKFKTAKMMKSHFFKTKKNYTQIIQNLYQHYEYSNYNILNEVNNSFF